MKKSEKKQRKKPKDNGKVDENRDRMNNIGRIKRREFLENDMKIRK